MNRISRRITNRIASVVATIKCPACGERVVPTFATPPPSAPESQEGKRWSFIWRPPSGEVCPKCQFPLARYARRAKYIRSFFIGIVFLVASFTLIVLQIIGGLSETVSWVGMILGGIGLIVLVVGLVGIILGTRHDPAEPGIQSK